LSAAYPLVMVEGAGSPAEINLRAGDIANMGFAEAVDCPVLLIADINRGGVFAHLVGTLELLSPSEQARVKGFIINRFRGDIALLQPGLDWLEQRTGKPVIGVLPYVMDLHLEAEDGIDQRQTDKAEQVLKVVVPVLPRISNHTDFDPLRLHPQVDLQFIGPGQAIPAADLIILPGSKSVRSDLAYLRANGWETAISPDICAMAEKCWVFAAVCKCSASRCTIRWASKARRVPVPVWGCWRLKRSSKKTSNCAMCVGAWRWKNAEVSGYEIHAGVTTGPALENAAVQLDDGRCDGAQSVDGQIFGTYLHGLFESPAASAGAVALGGFAVTCRKSITTGCASVISSGWRIWWRSIWIPGCCVNSVGFRVPVLASSRASPLPQEIAFSVGAGLLAKGPVVSIHNFLE
jgi:adenosylcobyric acid synthase